MKRKLPMEKLKKSQFVKQKTKNHTRTRQVNSFVAVLWTKPETKETVIMYRNGKIVILGCKSIQQGEQVASWVAGNLKNNEIEVGVQQHNIVAHGKFNTTFDFRETLSKLRSKGRRAIYEPELSAPIKYHLDRATCLLFRNGKVILTGVKTQDELDNLIATLENDLEIKFDQ